MTVSTQLVFPNILARFLTFLIQQIIRFLYSLNFQMQKHSQLCSSRTWGGLVSSLPGLVRVQALLRKSSIKKAHYSKPKASQKSFHFSSDLCPTGTWIHMVISLPKVLSLEEHWTGYRVVSVKLHIKCSILFIIETRGRIGKQKVALHEGIRARGASSAAIKSAKTKILMPAVPCHTHQITSYTPGFTSSSYIWTRYNSCVNKPDHIHSAVEALEPVTIERNRKDLPHSKLPNIKQTSKFCIWPVSHPSSMFSAACFL